MRKRECSKGLGLVLVIALNALLLVPLPVSAQTETENKSVDSGSEQIESEKKEAIDELLEITELDKRIVLMKKVFIGNAEKTFRLEAMREARAKNKELSLVELKEVVQEKTKRMAARYQTMFEEQIELESLVRTVACKLYAKYFTAQEIREIIAFYKTTTGSKARLVMPRLSRESMILTQKEMKPKLKSILTTVLNDEFSSTKSESSANEESDSTGQDINSK